jgi:hypothetical protein
MKISPMFFSQQGHSWTARAEITDPAVYWGSLGGTTSVTFDPSSGLAQFLDLQLTVSGAAPVRFTIESNPADYVLTTEMEVYIFVSFVCVFYVCTVNLGYKDLRYKNTRL